ncbi:MAG TPA: hypothetical protein VMV26_13670 [Alphaproteobacteria bacterium]|jgi:hypothetical protein|nr:hypothetical protein [Alphaproteobacteria bacterium]
MSNGAAPPTRPTRLPVLGTIVLAYGFAFRNAGPLLRAAVVPFAVTLIADLRLLWAIHEHSMAPLARLLWFFLPFVATVPFAAQCQRYVLDTTPANRPRFGFPWSRRETAFMLHAMGLFGLALLLNAIGFPLVMRLVPGSGGTGPIGIVLYALFFVLTVYIVARFTLVLPAAALGRALSWGVAWRRAADHGVGLALILVLAPLPWLVPSAIQLVAGPDATEIGRFLVTTAVVEACGLASTAIAMIALAAAYRWIMGAAGLPPSRSGA